MQVRGISVDNYQIIGVCTRELPDIWDSVAPRLEKALLRGRAAESVDMLRKALVSGKAQLWLVVDGNIAVAVAVTEVDLSQAVGVLRIVTLTGKGFNSWGLLLERALSTYAVAHGCRFLIFSGRSGWARKLIARNWSIESVNLAKELL